MTRNIQEYIDGLINKEKIFYLDLNNNPLKQNKPNCPDCNQPLTGKIACNNCLNNKQLEGEIQDLKEFTNLRGINMANNQITSLEFLNTLPHKEQLKSLNMFGNQVKEVDFAILFTEFPQLEKINLQGNPLGAKNLENLTSEQFGKLVNGIKENKIRINSYKGTILMDLLEHSQKLAQQGNNEYQEHYQALTRINQPIKSNNEQPNNNNKTLLLIGGIFILATIALAIGYYLGKKRKS